MKDQEILDKIKKGDERALDFLYQKHYKMMTNLVLKNNGTEEEAKDVYQEALLAFWKKAASGSLVLTSKISTYLYSICMNQWRKELDRKSRLSREEVDGVEYQTHEDNEKLKIVMSCNGELGDVCKKILTYYYFEGLSMNDIAENLNFANTDTAKTKKYKCKKKLDSLIKSKYTATDFFD